MKRSGFTFIELMIAIAIGAFVTVTAAAAMRGIVAGRQTHQQMTELSDAMRYACSLLGGDLHNLFRSPDFRTARFELSYLDTGDDLSGHSLTFYTVSLNKARPLEPESDVYEVQYFVRTDAETGQSLLMRRCCPVVPGVQIDEEDAAQGLLAPVAEHVNALMVRCYNGSKWVDAWSRENGDYPELIEVTLSASLADGKKSQTRSIFVNLPRPVTDPDEAGAADDDTTSSDDQDYDAYMSDRFSEDTDTEDQP